MEPELARFDAAAFLRDHWQRQPLLIRNPWATWRNPLEPDELAGLACEEGVESRLLEGTGATIAVEHGPLEEDRFDSLGSVPWTLLVQAVDQHVPAVADLIEPFRFIPDWRIDDVMVSYATTGGGVGAHFDQYDVFLIQGLGRRRWRVGQHCDRQSALVPHPDLQLLETFTAEVEWELEPGDILYLPPGVAHDGVALTDDCMTYSIGFRAPAHAELIAAWCDEVLDTLGEDDRYGDAGAVVPQDNPGEITAAALERLQAAVLARLADPAGFARMFGAQATTPRYPDVDWRPDRAMTLRRLKAAQARGAVLERNPAARFAFVANGPDTCLLFVNGECQECGAETNGFARLLCGQRRFGFDPAWPATVNDLIVELCNAGVLALGD